jgi:hypothetical protein
MNIYNTQGAFTGNSALKTTQVLDAVGNKTGFYVVRYINYCILNHVQGLTPCQANRCVDKRSPNLHMDNNNEHRRAHHSYDRRLSHFERQGLQDPRRRLHCWFNHSALFYWRNTHLVCSLSCSNLSSDSTICRATIDGKDVILVYGNAGELHETAFKFSGTTPVAKVLSGPGVIKQKALAGGSLALQYTTTGQTVVQVGNVLLYVLGQCRDLTQLCFTLIHHLDRANAYQFWVLHPPTQGAFAQFSTENPVIVKGGYLLRTVAMTGSTLAITGDLNNTASFEIIAPAASSRSVTFNGSPLSLGKTSYGTLTAKRAVSLPVVTIPNLSALTWVRVPFNCFKTVTNFLC